MINLLTAVRSPGQAFGPSSGFIKFLDILEAPKFNVKNENFGKVPKQEGMTVIKPKYTKHRANF